MLRGAVKGCNQKLEEISVFFRPRVQGKTCTEFAEMRQKREGSKGEGGEQRRHFLPCVSFLLFGRRADRMKTFPRRPGEKRGENRRANRVSRSHRAAPAHSPCLPPPHGDR